MIIKSTKNKTLWINTKQYIIIHHTWTKEWTIKWVVNTLTTWAVSCHYIVDINSDIYKIWEDNDILWHAWVSSWGKLKNMNNYSIGIEVLWPSSDWWFPFIQRSKVKELIQELMKLYNIPKENILRHKDISPWRKIDIADTFWNNKYKSWKDYQNSLN